MVERQQLLLVPWSEETFVEENALSVNVARLRRKLPSLDSPEVSRQCGACAVAW